HDGRIELSEAAALLGVDPNDSKVQALVNNADLNGNGNGIIDPAGFAVDTGSKPVYLDMSGPVIHAQGSLDINVAGVVDLGGTVAFNLGATQTVNLTDGTMDTVTTMTLGASNVHGFIGWGGSYFDANGNPTGDPNVQGLALSDVNVGVFLGLSTHNPTDPAAYFAMHLSVGSLQTVGQLNQFLQLNATLS